MIEVIALARKNGVKMLFLPVYIAPTISEKFAFVKAEIKDSATIS